MRWSWCLFALPVGHAAAIVALPAHATPLSLAFLVLAPAVAAVAAWLQVGRPLGGRRWLALVGALVLWTGGMAATAVEVLHKPELGGIDRLPMLLFVLYGVPLTFVMASPRAAPLHLRFVDGVLALMLGILFYIHTDTFGDGDNARAFSHLRWMFDVENAFIALFAAVRFSASVHPGERHFFGIVLVFATVYGCVAWYANH